MLPLVGQDAGAVAELAAARKAARYAATTVLPLVGQVRSAGKSLPYNFSQLRWNHSARSTVRLSRFSAVLVDGFPKFPVKLETAAFFPAVERVDSTLQCFMTALLMRCRVIPANFVVFCNRSNFCHHSGSYAAEG